MLMHVLLTRQTPVSFRIRETRHWREGLVIINRRWGQLSMGLSNRSFGAHLAPQRVGK
jgi:hypothetical protein